MAQTDFLQGEITEQFLVGAEPASAGNDGSQIAPIIPATVLFSILYCPAITALSVAFCTQ